MRCARVFGLLVVALTIVGCGDRPSTSAAPPARPDDSRLAARGLFDRHDTPPNGVAQQITYYQEGGPTDCNMTMVGDPDAAPAFSYGRDPLGGAPIGSAGRGREPEVGEVWLICAAGFDGGAKLTLRGAGLTRTVDMGQYGRAYVTLDERYPPGVYDVTASDGAATIRDRIRIAPPGRPGYRVVQSRPDPRVLVVGLRPYARFHLSTYSAEYGSDRAPTGSASYTAGVWRHADRRGIASISLPLPNDLDDSCFIVKVEVGGRQLPDKHNILSTICTPYNPYLDG